MKSMHAFLLTLALGASPLLTQAQGAAANFPNKPIKILVPFNAGSGADSSSRFYGEQIGKILGQQVLVENKPGGSGVIAVQATRQAPADGYTILMGSNSPVVVNAITMKNLPYDPFITAARRDPKYPDIPTMKESGFPDFETGVWSAFFMHADVPTEIVDKLAAAMEKAMNSEAGRAYQATQPTVSLLMGPKELGEFQLREYQRFKRVADAAGIKPE